MMVKYTVIDIGNDRTVINAEWENGIQMSIPTDPANSDYQRYLRWLENPDAEEGGTL